MKLLKITVKAFLVGHTFTLCDVFYGVIENKSYKKQLEQQSDWEKVMTDCGIDVTAFKQENIYNFSWLEKVFH